MAGMQGRGKNEKCAHALLKRLNRIAVRVSNEIMRRVLTLLLLDYTLINAQQYPFT